MKSQPCPACRAADARDAAHARGCPKLPPLTRAELIDLAIAVEAGWREDNRRREERMAAVEHAHRQRRATLAQNHYAAAANRRG